MGDRKWTTEQQRAIDTLNRRLLVSAAAGSGKTAVLVERIIKRLLDKNDPVTVDKLLVVTFTHAAAAEMKKRIRDALEKAKAYDQMAVIDTANIQTIDSFCWEVVKNHADELDMDPAVRIAAEAELSLIKADVMEELLEKKYEEADDDFINFLECFGDKKTGSGADELIYNLAGIAQVTRDPEEWYNTQIAAADSLNYLEYAGSYMRHYITSFREEFEKALDMCSLSGGPTFYAKALNSDLEFLDAVEATTTYEEINDLIKDYKFERLSGKKGAGEDEALKERVKNIRDAAKKGIGNCIKQLSRKSLDVIKDETAETAPHIKTLINLTRDYSESFAAAKRKRKILDFNDIEHMALKVLDETDEYKSKFEEIYVDEYQDTNELQEAIVGKLDKGRVFMVGDVKQSIYRFRQARPEIFIGKYESFCDFGSTKEDRDTLLELNKNFRSKEKVLKSVNDLFERLMEKSLGGISYTKDVFLNPGTPEASVGGADTELMVCDVANLEHDDDKASAEARMIGDKIKELKANDENLKYRDIVILLRSVTGTGETYLSTLLSEGIPAQCTTSRGYFDSLEIRTMLSVLMAIDNPDKPIPVAAYLKSPMVGMTDSELALMDRNSYKYKKAMEAIERYHLESKYMSVEELITDIYDTGGYYDYACALPAGDTRKANLDKLRAMAAEYAQTGYRGLFNFIRYVENLKSYDTDFGEAGALGENDDAVRIMSIHKSKGLEFPVVFIANAGKQFNTSDIKANMVMDPDLGCGCIRVDLDKRIKYGTLKEFTVKQKLKSDSYGEEMRILYVAMTRAEERLIITATTKDKDALMEQYDNARTSGLLSFAKRIGGKSYLDWILDSGVRYPIKIVDVNELHRNDDIKAVGEVNDIKKYLDGLTVDPSVRDELDEVFNFEYAHQEDVNLRNKISISELKKRWQEDLRKEELLTGETVRTEYSETSQETHSTMTGADRGTLYHSVMEKLDYANPENSLDSLPEAVERTDIEAWLSSDIGIRAKAAFAKGKLFREHQFIMGLPARDIKLAEKSEEPVLVQGIIDAWIMEDDGIVLIDYKTDKNVTDEDLINRYEGQLYYYAKALEMMKGMKVKTKIIWSFSLGHSIIID